MFKPRRIVGAAVFTLACILASPVLAAVPPTITQQGRLLNTDGTPVTAQVTMVFSAYASAIATTALWTESQAVTPDAAGYFSVQLGSVTAFPTAPALWDGSTRFLGVKVGTDPEMTPREQITSVPYAIVANDVTGDIHPTSITVAGVPIVNSSGQIALGGATIPCAGCVNTASIAALAVTSAQIATGTLRFTPSISIVHHNAQTAPIGAGNSAYATVTCAAGEQLASVFCNPYNTGMDIYTAQFHPELSPPSASCGCKNITASSQICSIDILCLSVAQTSIP